MFRLFIIVLSIGSASAHINFFKDFSFRQTPYKKIQKELSDNVLNQEILRSKLKINGKDYKVNYTINSEFEEGIKKIIRRHTSDYTSVVVIDNNTGRVLSVLDHSKKDKMFGRKLSFSTEHPAASIFKVVTATDLVENDKADPSTLFSYNGRSTTLYKYQLKDKKNRWTRNISFGKAFAYSNNVVFGKAAIKKSSQESLYKTARSFGFERPILQFLNLEKSELSGVDTTYNLAELASGFNRDTVMSPVQGAYMASILAGEGKAISPYLISSIKEEDDVVWQPSIKEKKIIEKDSATKIQDMMEMTVKKGTARGAFRKWRLSSRLKELEIGGKTGSITGGEPFGKRDWFVAYAKEKNSKDKGISICVMIINLKKWYIKSPYLAKKIIQYYYDYHNSNRNT